MSQEPASERAVSKIATANRSDHSTSPAVPARELSLNGKPVRIDVRHARKSPGGQAEHTVPRPHFLEVTVDRAAPLSAPTHGVEEFVYCHGQHYDSYLATEPGRLHFWSSRRDGLISYIRRGNHLFVGGGLIAPPISRANLLGEFTRSTEGLGQRAVFFNVSDSELPLFTEFGFQSTKWGEEPIVELRDRTWRGKQFEWVRRQTNYCQRHGLVAEEIRPDVVGLERWPAILAELQDVARSSLSMKAQAAEMRFFEGSIETHELGLRRLFVARSGGGTGRIEGFVVCNPINGGQSWSTELYRHRPDSVRGTVAFLFHHIMQALQEEGIESLALCLDPARNCATPRPGDNWLVRRGMTFADRFLGVVFDFAGLRHFKSRFRPRYENRYICSRPAISLRSVWAFINVCGGLRIDLAKLSRVAMTRLAKREQRKTLAGSDLHDATSL